MKRRSGLSRTATLGVVVIVVVIVIAGVFAVLLSSSKQSSTTSTKSTTSSTSTTTSRSSTSATTTTTTTAVPVGFALSHPLGVTYDSLNGYLYVTNNSTNTVSVINLANGTLVKSVPVGQAPAQVALDPANGYLFVTNNDSDTVSVIDGHFNIVINTITLGGIHPDGIAFDPVNNCMYVAEHGNGVGGNTISVINATSDTHLREINAIFQPTGVAYDSSNGNVYVTSGGSSVLVINPANNTLTQQIRVGIVPEGITFDAANGNLYVTNYDDGTVSVISGATNTVVATINVSAAVRTVPFLVAVDTANGDVMVSNDYKSGADVINATSNEPLTTVSTGGNSAPAGLAFDPANGNMYVAAEATNAIVVISPSLAPSFLSPPTGSVSSTTTTASVTF